MLSHAGIRFNRLESLDEGVPEHIDVVLDVLSLGPESAEALLAFAERGGKVISYAGLNTLAESFGFREMISESAGYAELPEQLGEKLPLRYLQARPWVVDDASRAEVEQSGLLHAMRPDGEERGAALLQYRPLVGQHFAYDRGHATGNDAGIRRWCSCTRWHWKCEREHIESR